MTQTCCIIMSVEETLQNKKSGKIKWTVHDSRVNLAALLNDPRKARRDYDLFTKTWGETFRDLPPGSKIRRSKWIPNVQKEHFADYLTDTSDQLLRYDSKSPKTLHGARLEDYDVGESSSFVRNDKSAIKTAITAQQEREAVMKTRIALDALPKMFLRSDFNMSNPHMFASVLNVHHQAVDDSNFGGSRNREIRSSRMLQEKLSHYLDLVEMAIIRQISLQSDAFFKAMESHEELHEYLNKTVSSANELIQKLKLLKKNMVDNSLQVVHLKRSYVNSEHLLEKLQMMVTVHQTQPTIQLLLSTSEYAGSLDLIKTTQEVLHQELAGLHCFRHLSSQLTEMERVIGQMMRQEMGECLRNEIHRSVTDGHACLDPHKLTAVMLGLIRQGQFEFLQEFKDEIEVAVKTIIKNTVSDVVGEPEEDGNETLASRMRMLEFLEWISLLNNLFDNLLIFLRRVKVLVDLLSGVAKESVARGDVCTTRRVKPFIRTFSNRKTRLKQSNSHSVPPNNSIATRKRETSNPFLDSGSTSDSYDEKLNPFENESRKSSNPFSSPDKSPQKSVPVNTGSDANNPFSDNLSDHNDMGDALMDGLASYEDELINSAANSFVPPADMKRTQQDKVRKPPEVEANYSTHETTEEVEEVVSEDVITSDACDGFLAGLRDLLIFTLDFEQDRCVKVLIAKGKDNSLDRLSSGDFLKLAKSIERYTSIAENTVLRQTGLNRSENSGWGMSSSLRGALKTQASKFIARFHEERRNKLSLILDNEVWKQAEVPVELANLLSNLTKGKVSVDTESDRRPVITNGNSGSEQQKVADYLILDGEEYAVAGTVLIMLKMVSEYCKCSGDLPGSTPDLIHRLRDLLTLFNSRTCQLVLGAGALQLVGLKTITTKNLALASRCLQLVLHCIPAIKRHFEAKLIQLSQSNDDKSQKQMGVLRHFDHVTKDYQDHVNEVENKLTVIVMGVVDRQLDSWEVKAPVPSLCFRNICKQITKFYDTVSSLLPQAQICRLLISLNSEFKSRLRSLLHRYNVRNDGGPQHGLVTSDLAYYESSIKNLKGMEKVDLKMITVWS